MQLTISSKPILNQREALTNKNHLSIFSIVLIFVSVLHHSIFCLINTHLIHVSSSYLVLTELTLLGITSLLFIRNLEISFLIIFILIFANSFVLAVFQHGLDPKHIRNFMIPVLMIWLGAKYNNQLSTDNLVKVIAYIFLAFGLFELLLPGIFQKIFNVLDFQIAVGRNTEHSLKYAASNFSLNGTRFGGRNLLGFLGDHRVASFYLETVNTSNLCTLLAAWGLSKKNIRDGMPFYLVGLFVAILADSRFGVTLILALTILRLLFHKEIVKYIAYFSPVLVITICVYFGWDMQEFVDDFKTRLGSTGKFLMNFTALEFFGLENKHYSAFVDQGYARLLHFQGIIFIVIMWICFCRLKVKDPMYKYLIAIIISANLAISGDSVFAFKWVALMWFLLGTTLVKSKNATPVVNQKYVEV